MQFACPHCKVLVEIPDQYSGAEMLHIECGACHHRFKLQLNRPSLKVRRPVSPIDGQEAEPAGPALESILLTVAATITGRRIEQQLGRVSSSVPLGKSEEEREAGMLEALAAGQEALRAQARELGADGVVGVQMEPVGPDDAPLLTMSGTAVRLSQIVGSD